MSKPAGFGRPVTVILLVLLGMVAPLTATGAAQSEDEGLISETEYESPQFGYAVEWEETWEAQEEGTESSEEGGYDLLTLSSGPAVFQIYAAEAGGATAEEEVERLIESYGDDYDDFETIDKGGDDELAAAIVDYDLEGTLVRDLTEVRLVDDGDTLLTVVVFAPVDDFEDAVDDAQESITLDRDPPFSTLDLVDISATTSIETDTQTETATETETETETAVDTETEAQTESATPTDTDSDTGDDAAEVMPQYRGGLARTGEQPGPAPENEPETLWTFETGEDFGVISPAVAGDRIFFGTNALYTVDRESGEEVSSIDEDFGFTAAMTVADGIVYAAYEGAAIYAYDPEADEILWEFATGGEVLIGGSPLVSEGIVYTSTFNGFVFAIDAESGEEVWRSSIGSSGGPLTLVDGVLYVTGGEPAVMYAFDPENGEVLWSNQYGAGATFGASAVVGETIYVGNADGSLYALGTDDGDEVWSVELGGELSFPASPAVVDGVVYADTDKTLYALNADDGEELWTVELDDRVTSEAVVVDETIIIGDESGTLYALDAAQEGEELWSVELDGSIEGSPVVLDGVIYVDSAGTLYALRG